MLAPRVYVCGVCVLRVAFEIWLDAVWVCVCVVYVYSICVCVPQYAIHVSGVVVAITKGPIRKRMNYACFVATCLRNDNVTIPVGVAYSHTIID